MVLKLPQWAQKHIQHINGLRLRAELELTSFLSTQTRSKVYTRVGLMSKKGSRCFISFSETSSHIGLSFAKHKNKYASVHK